MFRDNVCRTRLPGAHLPGVLLLIVCIHHLGVIMKQRVEKVHHSIQSSLGSRYLRKGTTCVSKMPYILVLERLLSFVGVMRGPLP